MATPFDPPDDSTGSNPVARYTVTTFVSGRETDTSICTLCYSTITPDPGQTLTEAQWEHSCRGPLTFKRPISDA
jgi:hypothetical protein